MLELLNNPRFGRRIPIPPFENSIDSYHQTGNFSVFSGTSLIRNKYTILI